MLCRKENDIYNSTAALTLSLLPHVLIQTPYKFPVRVFRQRALNSPFERYVSPKHNYSLTRRLSSAIFHSASFMYNSMILRAPRQNDDFTSVYGTPWSRMMSPYQNYCICSILSSLMLDIMRDLFILITSFPGPPPPPTIPYTEKSLTILGKTRHPVTLTSEDVLGPQSKMMGYMCECANIQKQQACGERATNERKALSRNRTILFRLAYSKLLLGAQLVRVTAFLLAAVLRSRWKAGVAPAAVNIEYYGTSQNKSETPSNLGQGSSALNV